MAPKKKDTSVNVLIKQRNNARESIKRVNEYIQINNESLTSEELDCRLEIVESYFQQALDHQAAIEHYDKDFGEDASAIRAELEDLYCKTKVAIRVLMKSNVAEIKIPTQHTTSKLSDNLPKLKLPVFTGKYADYTNFINLFTTLIDNDSRLTTVEKFNHLVSCLSDVALRTVKALDITDDNYAKALSMLDSRYNNKYLMCEEHINSLFSLQKTSKGSPDQLRALVDTVTARFNALSSLISFEELSNALIVHLALSSLDNESQQKIQESIDYTKSVSWNQCSEILSKRCQVLEARSITSTLSENRKNSEKKSQRVSCAATNNPCQLCKAQDHQIWKCSKFIELSPMQRYDAVKAAQLCINCLSAHHSVKQCKSSTCKHCKSRHHSLLHRTNQQQKGQQSSIESSNQQCQLQQQQANTQQVSRQFNNSFQATANSNNSHTSGVAATGTYCHLSKDEPIKVLNSTILATALVEILDKYGNIYSARVLLDSASQLNFITSSLAQKLNLNKVITTTVVGGIGQSHCRSNYATNAVIRARQGDYSVSLDFLIIPTITGQQPSCRINTDDWNI